MNKFFVEVLIFFIFDLFFLIVLLIFWIRGFNKKLFFEDFYNLLIFLEILGYFFCSFFLNLFLKIDFVVVFKMLLIRVFNGLNVVFVVVFNFVLVNVVVLVFNVLFIIEFSELLIFLNLLFLLIWVKVKFVEI